jgi:hypothetical protein
MLIGATSIAWFQALAFFATAGPLGVQANEILFLF